MPAEDQPARLSHDPAEERACDSFPRMLEILEDGRLIDPRRTPKALRTREEEFAYKQARDEGWRV